MAVFIFLDLKAYSNSCAYIFTAHYIKPMYQKNVEIIHNRLKEFAKDDNKMFITSSFQTHSIPMLHIITRVIPGIPVYFLNTGFHFPETIVYKNLITSIYNLNTTDLESDIPKSAQRDRNNSFHYSNNTDYCCYLNKVLPLENVLKTNDIWITGVRKDQNTFREGLNEMAGGKHNTLRYHPMLEWNKKMIWRYIYEHDIPHHPLEAKGYSSIGCEPCTAAVIEGREGRWAGLSKSECGIHTELMK